MTLLIIYAFIAIGFSFLCSILEAVLLSITPTYVSVSVKEGKSIGRRLQHFKDDIDRPLSAILTLNTIAHTVGAILVGMQAGNLWGGSSWTFLGFSAETYVAIVMTLLILYLSEIIPKTIGANNWQTLTPFTVRTLTFLVYALYPLVLISQMMTKLLKNDKLKSVLSRSDFAAMTNVGEESGALAKNESTIIKNLLRFEEMKVRDIMTPKTVVMMGEADMSLQEFYTKNEPLTWSRIPVFDDTRDNISGIVLKDDIFENLAEDKFATKLRDIQRPAKFIGDQTTLPALFEQLTQEKVHLLIVNDDFGMVVGIVTMEDLFETLLGREIMDETDRVADLQRVARKKWEARMKKKH